MSNEQMEMLVISMDTPTLAQWVQALKNEYRGMQRTIGTNQTRRERSHYLKRYIRISMKSLRNRQMRMKGF